jgi:hypothetical protein
VVKLKLWEADFSVAAVALSAGLLEITLACAIVYGVIRAIGWVISGFAAS